MSSSWFLIFLCQYGYDSDTRSKCQEILKSTITQWEIYRTIKETEKDAREFGEEKLSKPGFWLITTGISSVSTQRLYLSGHNVMGIDSVHVKLGKDSEISLTWSF